MLGYSFWISSSDGRQGRSLLESAASELVEQSGGCTLRQNNWAGMISLGRSPDPEATSLSYLDRESGGLP